MEYEEEPELEKKIKLISNPKENLKYINFLK